MGKECVHLAHECMMLGTIDLVAQLLVFVERGNVLFHTLNVLDNLAIIDGVHQGRRHGCSVAVQ